MLEFKADPTIILPDNITFISKLGSFDLTDSDKLILSMIPKYYVNLEMSNGMTNINYFLVKYNHYDKCKLIDKKLEIINLCGSNLP
jgi:hypothetical protein